MYYCDLEFVKSCEMDVHDNINYDFHIATLSNRRHEALKHEALKHDCDECGTSYLTYKGLQQHIEKYESIGISCAHNHKDCDYCDENFANTEKKLQHLVVCEETPRNVSKHLERYFEMREERRAEERPTRVIKKIVSRIKEKSRHRLATSLLKPLPPRRTLDIDMIKKKYAGRPNDDVILFSDEDTDDVVLFSDEENDDVVLFSDEDTDDVVLFSDEENVLHSNDTDDVIL